MQVNQLKNDGLERHFKVLIPSEQIQKRFDLEIESLATKINLPGFRKVKKDTKISSHLLKNKLQLVKSKYSISVKADAIKKEISDSIIDIIKENNFNLAIDPNIENRKDMDEGVEFILKLELLPEIKIIDFGEISLEKMVIKITDDNVSDYIKKMASNYNDYQDSKISACKGDKLLVDFYMEMDNNISDSNKDFEFVLGSRKFVPECEDQLVGSNIGDEVSVNVVFPKDYQIKSLIGKSAIFRIKIKEIKAPVAVKIDDDFAKRIKAKDLADLKEKVRNIISMEYDNHSYTLLKMHFFNKLENILDYDLPPSLLKKEYDMIKVETSNLKDQDLLLKEKSEQDLEEYYKYMSSRRVKIGLFLSHYAKEKGIKVENSDIEQVILQRMRQYPDQANKIIEFYKSNPKAVENLVGPIIEFKTINTIIEKELSVTEKNCTIEELDNFLQQENINMLKLKNKK